jgi:predicted nucleic acid-binding protein
VIVVDTNVVSELMRPRPAVEVVTWFAGQDPLELRLTAITVAELLYGLARLPAGERRDALDAAVDEVLLHFADEVLPFDNEAARSYAVIVTARERAGTPIAALDAQIAAICRVHDAVLATRNVKDFAGIGVDLLNPWSSAG